MVRIGVGVILAIHFVMSHPLVASFSTAPPPLAASNPFRLVHHWTLCWVPDHTNVWDTVTAWRTHLRDPGVYRWPPHVNLIYPFVDMSNSAVQKSDDPVVINDAAPLVDMLHTACQSCEPFDVTLSHLGTFGGKQRGVLWIYPQSYREAAPKSAVSDVIPHFDNDKDADDNDTGMNDRSAKFTTSQSVKETKDDTANIAVADESMKGNESDTASDETVNLSQNEPLIQLQHLLEEQLVAWGVHGSPSGNTNNDTGSTSNAQGTAHRRPFYPHMTLSHFPNITEAMQAQDEIDFYSLSCHVKEIYILQRVGDEGQFHRVVTLGLGVNGQVQWHSPPLPFSGMLTEPPEWLAHERAQFKHQRRKSNRRRGRR
jgi:hypothetical protein